jgi:hypothetical protein
MKCDRVKSQNQNDRIRTADDPRTDDANLNLAASK